MLSLANRVLQAIPDGQEPPVGTGPLGLSGGKRYKSEWDVIAHNSAYGDGGGRASGAGEVALPLSVVPPKMHLLRPYQEEAVDRVWQKSGKGGTLEIGCGLGKTFVASEIIRRRGKKAVVVCDHKMSVSQFVQHLQEMGFRGIATAKTHHRMQDPLPDIIVLTYNTVVRVGSQLKQHVESLRCLAEGKPYTFPSSEQSLLLSLMHVVPYGTLILDEAHKAVADGFQYACCVRHDLIVGMSGSLIREDMRLSRLASSAGPIVFRHFVQRTLNYHISRVDVSEEVARMLQGIRPRSTLDHAIRACHPGKMAALHRVATSPAFANKKMIVFCDSPGACEQVGRWMQTHLSPSRTLSITACMGTEERDEVLRCFAECARFLVSSRVCDTGIDLPDGTVVVQLYQSCGSRQQEIQRAGRGTRNTATECTMVHIVNRDTEEDDFMTRRVAFMSDQPENVMNLTLLAETEKEGTPGTTGTTGTLDWDAPLQAVLSQKVTVNQSRCQNAKKRRLLSSIATSGHGGRS